MEIAALEGATPIEPDELVDLIPSLTTLQELNQFEQHNISRAKRWALRSRKLRKNLLDIDSLKMLHRRMFDETWKWAGSFRKTAKNIGLEPHLIREQVVNLCFDVKYWIEHKTFPLAESAVRFHHRLVSIHPFVNGNGRHARLATDLLMIYGREPAFTWGGSDPLNVESETRSRYLAALKMADTGDFKELTKFALAD